MTEEKLRERIGEIVEARDDAEKAHSLEDDLHQDVLRAIAAGDAANPAALAKLALTTKFIPFKRWYA